jgi:hypothetical protein
MREFEEIVRRDAAFFGDECLAYLDLDFASLARFVAHSTVSPALDEIPRARTARELEVRC